MDCYIFVKLLLTTALLRKLGACRPCTPRRAFQMPAVLLYFFLGLNHGGVCFRKKFFLKSEIGSAWQLLTLNHFLISDYGLLCILPASSSPYDIAHHPFHREYVFVLNLQS